MKAKRICSILLAAAVLFAALLPVCAADKTYRNVIIMIGDGMGENHLHLAEQYGHTLFMNTQFDLRGQSRTRSMSHDITDSAAGGTALACGVRIINQTVGVYGADPLGAFVCPASFTEVAAEHGMRTGIVTTDKNNGATPAAFSVHVLYRKQYEKISQQQLNTTFDLIWGAEDGYKQGRDGSAEARQPQLRTVQRRILACGCSGRKRRAQSCRDERQSH